MRHASPRAALSTPLLISALAALVVSRPAAQSYRLNGSFLPSPLWKVDSYRLSADGTRVVFVARERVGNDSSKLYSAALDGSSAPIDVTPPAIPHFLPGVVSSPVITSDGSRVVCLFRDLKTHLYSVPIEGGTAVALSRNVTNTRDVIAFALSPDGQRVVYLADEDTNDVFELYSIPVDGSAPALKLSPTLPPNGDVFSGFQISPDGTRVVYQANAEDASRVELYSAPLDGSAPPVKLNGALPGCGRGVRALQRAR